MRTHHQSKPPSDIKRVYRLLSTPNKLRTILLFILQSSQAASELFFIFSLTFMGMSLASPDALRGKQPFSTLFYLFPSLNEWSKTPSNFVLLSTAVVVVVSLIKNLITYLTAKQTSLLGERISLDIGQEIMSRYMYMSYSWHLSEEGTSTFQRMSWRNHVARVMVLILSTYTCALALVTMMVSLMREEPILTALVVVITSFAGLLLYKFMRKGIDNLANLSTESAQEETRAVLCATRGIRDVIIYHKQPIFLGAIVAAAKKGITPRIYTGLASSIPTWVLEFVGFCVMLGALVYLVYVEHADNARLVAGLGLLLVTAWRVLPYANRIVGCKVDMRAIRPMALQVIALLEDLRKSPTSHPPAPTPNFAIHKDIQFKDVSFSYPNSTIKSLDKLNFSIKVGSKIGVIGVSGAGKSTLVSVLCGLFPPTEGEILVDGYPLTPESLVAYSSLIGYVPQNPFLFAGSLAENVAFKDWGETIDERRVTKACKDAAIDFIDAHPDGIHLAIGDNGVGISGGQAQRISIARALYCNPRLIIFDEATSSLDKFAEAAIQNTIYDLAKEVTCVIIAHRLETVEQCDTIIWLDKGKIVEIGEAASVLNRYRELKLDV